nr:protein NLRC5-like [Hydra vulgaris]
MIYDIAPCFILFKCGSTPIGFKFYFPSWLDVYALRNINQNHATAQAKAVAVIEMWIESRGRQSWVELKEKLITFRCLAIVQIIEKEFPLDSSNPLDVASRANVNKDISEVCTALKNYYLKYYGKINELRPLLKTPASVDLIQKFVDLCIVDAYNAQIDVVCSNEQKQFFKKQMSYTPIPYSEVFMNEKSVILISGIAGIGKTWLLRKCLLDWSNNLIWNNVELVFYLECRRLNQYQNVSNINELLNVFYKHILNDFDISKHTTLFIIDGLDEFKYLNELLNPNLSCTFPIVNALAEIQSYKHVVAGRVYAIDKYQNIYPEHIDKLTIQIMGFNQNGVENYVENHVIEEKKEVVKATLKESPIAKVMATVPFYLSFMCKIISDSSKIYTTSFLTMTELHANIFLIFFAKTHYQKQWISL